MKPEVSVKIRMPTEIREHVRLKAGKLGVTSASYLRFLAMKDAASPQELHNIYVIENIEGFHKLVNKLNLWKYFKKNPWPK